MLKLGFLGLLPLVCSIPTCLQAAQLMIGQAAPAFRLASLERQTVALEDLRGRFVVIHFAASWWPFCNAEAPHLEALHKKYKGRGVQVLVIDVKETRDKADDWARKWKFTFPVLLDPEGKATATYAPPGVLPDLAREEVPIASNLIIDREGKIRFYSLLDSAHFDAKLVALTGRLEELLKSK